MSSFNSLAKDLHSLDLIKILYLIENDRENYKNISEEEKNYFKKIIENNNDLFELNFLINLFSFFDISQFNNTLNIIGKEYFKNSKVKKGVLTQREIKIMRYRKYFEK